MVRDDGPVGPDGVLVATRGGLGSRRSRSSWCSCAVTGRGAANAGRNATGAWVVLAALAHNLLRWTQLLGLPDTTVRAARTLRRRLLSIPGRLARHARGWTLHLPAR